MNTTTSPYREMTAPDGRLLTVRVDEHHDHTAVTVVSHPDADLNRAMPHDEANAYLAFLAQAWEAGTQLWLIEEQAGVLTSAAAALDHFEAELIADINATLDDAHADLTANIEAQQAAVADIMADTKRTGGWSGARTAAKKALLHPERRVRPTRTNVHTKPLTPAMLDLIRNHRDGVVVTRPGQTWTVLRGIYERIGGQPVYQPGTHIMRSLRLNQRGLDIAGQGQAAA